MPARAEVLGDGTIGREELLGVSRRLKPLGRASDGRSSSRWQHGVHNLDPSPDEAHMW